MSGNYGTNTFNTLSPSNSGASNYKTNVTRTKTRKWVEAKTQNYDGDDWGNEYDDGSGEDEEPEPAPAATRSHTLPTNTAAARSNPGSRTASPAQRAPFAQPSLHVDTQQPSGSSPRGLGNSPTTLATAPAGGSFASPASRPPLQSPSSSVYSSRPGFAQRQDTSSSLPSQTMASRTASPIDRLRQGSVDQHNLARVATPPAMSPNVASQSRPSAPPPDIHRRQTEQTPVDSPDVGVQGNSTPTAAGGQPEAATPDRQDSHQDDLRRFSNSPKLPDVARMSVFGGDFFSNAGPPRPDGGNSAGNADLRSPEGPIEDSAARLDRPSESKGTPTEPAETSTSDSVSKTHADVSDRPPLPGGWVTETPTMTVQQGPAGDGTGINTGGNPQYAAQGEIDPRTQAPNDHGETHHDEGNSSSTMDHLRQPEQAVFDYASEGPSDFETDDPEAKRLTTVPEHALPPGQPYIQRISTDSSIGNSSPIKESDILREDILRSLSPDPSARQPPPENDETGPRESTYLSDVYGDYLTPGAGEPEQKTAADVKLRQAVQEQPPPLRDSSPEVSSPAEVQEKPTRPRNQIKRRFSWEANSESETEDTAKNEVASPDPSSTLDPHEERAGSTAGYDPSQESSHGPSKLDLAGMGSPSPLSVPSDARPPGMAGSADEGKATSEADSKSRTASISQPASPSSQPSHLRPEPVVVGVDPDLHFAMGPSGQVQIPTFQEIMEKPTSDERIQMFEQTRAHLASADEGLDGWLRSMRTDYPEHAGATAEYGTDGPPMLDSEPKPLPGVMGQSAQKPYYQQYLSASANSAGMQSSQAGRLGGHFPASMPISSSELRHSGGQAATKSKDFLMAAGKAGKGLFSKGKSKLRDRR